jgi:hypothetical protein
LPASFPVRGAGSRPRSRSSKPQPLRSPATHAERGVTFTVTKTVTKKYKQARAGRPGPETDDREILTSHFTLQADIALDRVAYDAANDGCFPLISNDRDLADADVLGAYR